MVRKGKGMEFIIKPNRPFEFTDVGLIFLGEKGRHISELDLYGCENITDEGLLALSCPNVIKIDIRFCKKLTAQGVANFVAKCPALRELIMNKIDANLLSLLRCPTLVSFIGHDLANATDHDLQIFLSNVPALEKLRLNTAPLVKGGFINALVEHCKNLRLLDLRNIPILATKVSGEMPHVTELVLDLSSEGIGLILPLCPNVQDVEIYEWVPTRCSQLTNLRLIKITDEGLANLAHNCLRLVSISIENGRNITDRGLSALLTLCPDIGYLMIKRCAAINGSKIQGAETVKLINLELDECASISDEGLKNILKYCADLYSLSITNCNQVAAKTVTPYSTPIRFISEPMEYLENVCLKGNDRITDVSLVDLASVAPHLERISLSDCPNITIKGLLYLVEHCPLISILTLWNCKISEIELLMLEQKGGIQINAYRGLRAYSSTNPDFSFDYNKETPEAKVAYEKFLSLLTQENHMIFHRELPAQDLDLSKVISLGLSDLSITDQEFDALLQRASHLLELNLHDCPELTDSALESIVKQCPELTSLEIELVNFTSKGLVSYIKKSFQMVSLTCEHCDRIREDLESLYLQLSEEFPALAFSLH